MERGKKRCTYSVQKKWCRPFIGRIYCSPFLLLSLSLSLSLSFYRLSMNSNGYITGISFLSNRGTLPSVCSVARIVRDFPVGHFHNFPPSSSSNRPSWTTGEYLETTYYVYRKFQNRVRYERDETDCLIFSLIQYWGSVTIGRAKLNKLKAVPRG